jgi:uncharacterized integral membrane protein
MADEPERRPPDRANQTRIVVALIAVILVVLFMFMNTGRVSVDYVIFSRQSRLIYVILVAFILGVIAGQVLRRRRKR